MIAAEVVNGDEPETVIEKLLENPETAFVHARSVTRGCYTFRIERAMKTLELLPPHDTMYRALVNRDSSFEGIFFVGVRTTGIFCRPTCSREKAGAGERRFLSLA